MRLSHYLDDSVERMERFFRTLMLSIMILIGIFLVASCGDDDKNPTNGSSPATNEIIDSLTFERQDASTISMGTDFAICCGVWESGYIDKNTLKILFYDSSMQKAGWKLFVLVDEVAKDSTYTFPTAEAGQSAISMFIADLPTGNELNSDADESMGTIKITSYSCGPPISIEFTINATVGSEFFQGPTVSVAGTFKCTIYANPAPFGCDFSF